MKSVENNRKTKIGKEKSQAGSIPRSLKVSMAVMFSAVAIAASYTRPVYLNIEPMSIVIFLSGIALGLKIGAAVGSLSEAIFSQFNPYGPAPLPVFVAQIGCMMFIGISGGVFRRLYCESDSNLSISLKMGVAGFYLTLVFDLVTNLGSAISFYNGDYAIALLLGLYFMVIHVVSNTIIFGTIGPVVSRRVVYLIEKRGTIR